MTLFELCKKTSGYKTEKAVHRFYRYYKWYVCYNKLNYNEYTCKLAWNKYKNKLLKEV